MMRTWECNPQMEQNHARTLVSEDRANTNILDLLTPAAFVYVVEELIFVLICVFEAAYS